MTPVEALQPAIVVLGAGTVAALASRALKLSPMVGYIIAGLIMGPFVLKALREGDTTHLLAELGVVFLLFDIGLHFSLKEMRESWRDILGLAPIQMLLCGLVFTGAAYLLGCSWPIAITIGLSLALSSTAVVSNILGERGLNTCPLGRSSVAVLVFQDIVAIFLLIFVNSLAEGSERLILSMAQAAFGATVSFIAAALIGKFVIRPLFQTMASARVQEVFTMMAILIVVAAAAVTESIGLSLTLGAFLAGMAISDTPYRHAIQTEVTPFRGLLLSFFFINVGLMINLDSLIHNFWVILAVTFGIVLVKTGLVFLTARFNGWSIPGATQLAFTLAQASEFTLVVLSVTFIRAETPGDGVSILVASTALSLAIAPFWTGIGLKLAARLAILMTRKNRRSGDAISGNKDQQTEGPRAIVFGMTTAGRTVVDAMLTEHIPYIALENNPERFIRAVSDGYDVNFGDASDLRLFDSLGGGQAHAIILGEAHYSVSENLNEAVLAKYPNLIRYVAVEDITDQARHDALGLKAHLIQNEEDCIALASEVLRSLGTPPEKIKHWMETEMERLERDAIVDEDEDEEEKKEEAA